MKIIDSNKIWEAGYCEVNKQIDIKEARAIAMNKGFCGFLGAPFPIAYKMRKSGLPIYARYSEFEPINHLFDRFLVDPLASWGVDKYARLISEAQPNHKLIVVCPSVHGHVTLDAELVRRCRHHSVIEGWITATPDVVRRVLDEQSNGSA
jgi:hypothetical protein